MNLLFYLFKRLLLFLGIFVGIAVGVLGIGIFYYICFQLPSVDELKTIQLQVPLQIFTHDHKLMAEYGDIRRIPLPYDQIPKPLIAAVLATEDQRYFQHPGIDIPGLIRAAIKLAATGRKEEGGSTITMQVARSFYLNPHKTFGRKLREILLALKIENKLNKQKILELYLNKIFLGARAYGVEAAAEIYYGKSLNQLTLDQYAMLAGLPKAPSALNPLTNPIAALKRRNHVLTRMFDLRFINEKAYKLAIAAPLNARYHDLQIQIKAPYAGELVREQLQQLYGDKIYTDNFKVYTTIDSRLQDAANQAVRDHLIAYDQRHGYRGAEQNFGVPNLKQMGDWKKRLGKISLVNGLEAAVVVDIAPHSVTVLRSNGSLVVIPWQGLAWARKQINPDFLGRLPRTATEIVGLGDVVRVMENNQGWRLSQIPLAEAGLIALDPVDGSILALVGGFDYQHSNFNRITNANRQPGSSFKPFVYSAALDKGYTLATVINDAPVVVQNRDNSLWRPQNDEHRFYGPTRLRAALMQSRNLVSIRLLDLIGIPYAIDYIQRFGFNANQLPPGLSLALGTPLVTPLQMASAYAVFANGGFRVVPFIIDSIRDGQNQLLYQAKPLAACPQCSSLNKPDNTHAPRVISAQNAFLITSTLHDVIQHGTATLARSLQRKDLAGKTGTTQNQVDAWFAGYNSDLIAVAWMGYDHEQRSLHEWGAQAALPLWIQFMQAALQGRPEHPLEQPPGIVSIRIDPVTGKRAPLNDPLAKFEYFMTPYVPAQEQNPASQDNTIASGGDEVY
ncbi:MAG: mrcA [Gammaproteobacteria bacterium]|jgi:penicillin-binding protein 1A|nr:mrcA [Gammaproteobacteria bacterium]